MERAELEQIIDRARENRDPIRSLRDLDLDRLPESIGNLSNLKILNLGANQLASLPDNIGNLSNLTVLQIE